MLHIISRFRLKTTKHHTRYKSNLLAFDLVCIIIDADHFFKNNQKMAKSEIKTIVIPLIVTYDCVVYYRQESLVQ